VCLQHVQRPATRCLQLEVERNVQRFNQVMEQLIDEHRMFKKLADVHEMSLIAPTSVVKKSFNKWDRQLEDIIKCSEKRGCGKTYNSSHMIPVQFLSSGSSVFDFGDVPSSISRTHSPILEICTAISKPKGFPSQVRCLMC
jgi:hypothetical protein